MYKVLDVAGYVVDYSLREGKPITHIHLQKILYFLEAHYLVNENKSLFEDKIAKWKLGPVVVRVYHEYKTFGSRNIGYVPEILELTGDFEFTYTKFKPEIFDDEKGKIDEIIKKYIDKDPFDLVDATHDHTPWSREKDKIYSGVQGLFYDKEELKKYFEENRDAFMVNND